MLKSQIIVASISVLALSLAGCASTRPAAPSLTVIPGANKSTVAYERDADACDAAAQRAVGGQSPGAAANDAAVSSAVVGTAIGALAGAAIGGASGRAGPGAAIGAGTGLLAGSAIGAGDGALSAVLHDMVANSYHRMNVPNSAKHISEFLTYSSLSQVCKYANRVSYEVLAQSSPRLSRGLPEKEDSLEEVYWER